MSKNLPDVDCQRRCKSRDHGQVLTSAITKRSVSDQSLASFLKGTCANFIQAIDHEGRTPLHMAATRGRSQLAEWLIQHSSEAFINAKDLESGYTPLHRSIFYGQIHTAVALMKMGANTEIIDKDDYKAIEHATLDRQYICKIDSASPCDAYVWGCNSNYTLGTGAQREKSSPEPLSGFSRTGTGVLQVCLGKFHSVWLCAAPEGGAVYACGQLARAGALAVTALRPVLLRLSEPCVQVAVTLNSTVLLMKSGVVLQYGLNSADTSSQSNTKTPASIKLPPVKPILNLSSPLGICSSRVHMVVWNTRVVYTWGTNLGQLGHSQGEKVVDTPRRVEISMTSRDEATVTLAAAADAASIVATSRGDVYLLHRHVCKKIAIKQINLRQICVEAKVNENGAYSRVTVLLLTNVGQLRIWTDESNRLTTCVFGLVHQTTVTHVTLTHDAMYFTTKYGEAFIGYISRPAPVQATPKKDKDRDSGKTALVKFLEKDDCTSVRLVRIPNVHRAVSIVVDSEGMNFACLQVLPTCGLSSLPELSPSALGKHMAGLLETAAEDDLLHDVVFQVGPKLFPAHMFMVASGSELLYKHYKDSKQKKPDEIPTIVLDNVHQEVFQRILKYLYTGSCDVTEAGPCSLKIKREDLVKEGKKETENMDNEPEYIENAQEISAFEVYKRNSKKGIRKKTSDTPTRSTNIYCDPVKLVQAAAKRLQVMSLHKLLNHYFYRDGKILARESAPSPRPPLPSWDRVAFPDLVDTNVRSKDGMTVPAHRCVLAARLDYFQGMFLHSWTESKLQSTVTLPINQSILQPVIDFLYTDTCPQVKSSDSIDFICSLLVVADQLFITRLREMCEIQLADLITLKNCAELCQFAHVYNAVQLKNCCMEYISLNICAVLENRSLDLLDANLLEDITRYYCRFNPIMSSRVVTPFYNAPTDEVIEECAKLLPVDLSYVDDDLKRDDVEIKKKGRKKTECTDNERARKHYESVSSATSDLDTSGDVTLSLTKISESEKKSPEKWIKIPTSQQKVQARLKAISSTKDILNETPVESFVTLTKGAFSSSPVETSFARMSVSPKESVLADLARSPPGNITISHVGPKLSQKQRKKLALLGNDARNLEGFTSGASESPSKPKSPWKIIETPSTSKVGKAPVFNQILADQKKLKDDSSRIMMKPLAMTQMEDKAIEELERFYNIHEIDDELISVRRIELQVTAPKWVTTAQKL